MDSPLVSILIPVFRVESYIERCARSVFEQTYDNLEYIFVDDASPDHSIDILKRVMKDYPEREKQTRIIHHPCNKGLAAARNTAVKACHGTFVFHVDSDDWVETNAIQLLIEKQQETDADIITGQVYVYRNGQRHIHSKRGWSLEKDLLLTQILLYQVSISIWGRLLRKSLYTEHAIVCNESGSEGEDYQTITRLVYYANKVAGTNICIYHYDLSNQYSFTNNIKSFILQMQGYVSVSVVSDFFSDKEPHLQEIAKRLKVFYLHQKMILDAMWREKKAYSILLKLLRSTDTGYWHYIKWDNPIKRYIESHYVLICLTIPIRKICGKL